MITEVRGTYLRDESRYDRWGALGKVLAAVEVFHREGVELDALGLERYVNAAFPRTFSNQRIPAPGEALPGRKELLEERASVEELLKRWGIQPGKARVLATEEVAERRCLDAGFLGNYLK